MHGDEPFSAFMARALFDPQRGYYTRNIKTVGARGDFSTNATLSPLLGQAIAAWLKEEISQQRSVKHIIEIGAGDGSLMASIRKSLGWWTRRQFHFHIVETSAVLQTRQRQRLAKHSTTWHQTMAEALRAADGAAFIYHNEVLDAFPATLIQWQDDQWHEVFVGRDSAGRAREDLQPCTLNASSVFAAWQPPPHPRQRCEVHVSVKDWMTEWSPHWQHGAMLTMDYGDTFPALYHRRPNGTLRAYLLQHRLEGMSIYENPGRQDITADVNFTDYRDWARELGWEEAAYGTQADFIGARVKVRPGHSAVDDFLLNEHGAGHAFKHVIHRRLRR